MAEADFTNIVAASIATPAAGVTATYVELTTPAKRLSTKDDAGVVINYVGVGTTDTLTGKTIASSATVPYIADATGAGSKKMAGGSTALVTGTKVVATGLATVVSFQATLAAQPNATGAASPQILAATSITTGAVTVTAYSVSSVTGATIAANTSTGTFYWIAMGT
jgi:hypothetical protein